MKKNVDPIEYYVIRINEATIADYITVGLAAIGVSQQIYALIKSLRKKAGNDPEVQAAIADLESQSDRVKDTLSRKSKQKKKRHTKK